VHIAKKEDIFKLAKVPKVALKLIKKFWPGPLTLVLKKKKPVPNLITAGLDTVAIRMPKNKLALKLIKACGRPIAAPSANIFGKPSPTSVKHVIDDLGNKVDVIIDGGKTEIGVESTVLDLISKPFRIYRPGGVTVEELKKEIGELEVIETLPNRRPSPGLYKKHYSPKAKLILIERGDQQIKKMKKMIDKLKREGKKVGVLVTYENKKKFIGENTKVIGSKDNLRECAANLFDLLRKFDEEKIDVIVVEGLESRGLGLAIMNRLRKAADKQIN
jgi:L-threonylcarbamoyladenylate synthase